MRSSHNEPVILTCNCNLQGAHFFNCPILEAITLERIEREKQKMAQGLRPANCSCGGPYDHATGDYIHYSQCRITTEKELEAANKVAKEAKEKIVLEHPGYKCTLCETYAYANPAPAESGCFGIGSLGIHKWMILPIPSYPPKLDSAKRDELKPRFDLLVPEFINAMAIIGGIGAIHYGDTNYQKSRLEGGRSPINHMLSHLNRYQQSDSYDHPELGIDRKYHLAAIAFNAMMEFWWESKL